MTSRELLDAAIAHAGAAPRVDASKWRPLKEAFLEEFGADSVTGTLLTDEKQLKTRMVEIESRDPSHIVLCIVANGEHEVRPERVREWLAKPTLPSARSALIVDYDEQTGLVVPRELQVYQPDPVASKLSEIYRLTPSQVERPESAVAVPSVTGFAGLEGEWAARTIVADAEEWDRLREEAVPEHRDALDQFLSGAIGLLDFRGRLDSLSKMKGYWGFRGAGQMFFNQLVKAADESELSTALRAALPAPVSSVDAEVKLDAFLAAVDAIRERAQAIGATPPGRGRINFFVSFFWELVDREAWPILYPNSRNVLEEYGLLDTNLAQPELYTAFNVVTQNLKEALDTTTWGVEHLLWELGQGGSEAGAGAPAAEEDSATSESDLYASYRAQGLYFPDEVVTSLVLSLATKRFVILGGISGTGKTQIALGLARHLDGVSGQQAAEFEPPTSDENTAYIRMTGPRLRRGRLSLDVDTRKRLDARIGLPERGSSKMLRAKLPDGSVGRLRLNNIGFEDQSRHLWVLFPHKEVQAWVTSDAKPGEYLRLDLGKQPDADLSLSVVHGSATGETVALRRHELVAVRSDWTDPRGLLGFFNPLTSSYSRTTVVDLLLRAADDPEHAYIVVLDEMNLARVEYYFSDFLSAIESGEPIQLMSPGVEDELSTLEGDEIPAQLEIPPNVSFVGTVNIDETTHAFSPKVLDRANVIEFSDVEVERALGYPVVNETSGLRLKDGGLQSAWLCTSRQQALAPGSVAHQVETFTEALEDVHHLLARFNRQFGYRIIEEVSAFVGHALQKTVGEPDEIVHRAFDMQLRQKIIPKLSGGRELEDLLALLLDYCLAGAKSKVADVEKTREAAKAYLDPSSGSKEPQRARYPSSARKLVRMLDRIADTGFVGALD